MTSKQFTRAEISKNDNKGDTVFIIDNVVYNVSKFLDEHPGGHEVLVNMTGKDATEDFDDVGHSLDAKDLMTKYVVGELVAEDRKEYTKRTSSWATKNEKEETRDGSLSAWTLPILIGIVVTIFYAYITG